MLKLNEYLSSSAEVRWENFSSTLAESNKTPDYFVNWDKTYLNVANHELALNGINYLIAKQDIFEEALTLFSKYPEWLNAVPMLLAIREKEVKLIDVDEDGLVTYRAYNFLNRNLDVIDYVQFMDDSGLLKFLGSHAKKSLVDYAYGVEVGLDSNGRKNRSGNSMEFILKIISAELLNLLDLISCRKRLRNKLSPNGDLMFQWINHPEYLTVRYTISTVELYFCLKLIFTTAGEVNLNLLQGNLLN